MLIADIKQLLDENEPRACVDLYKSGSRVSGIYYVRDSDNYDYPVFCDFHSEPNKVYTLIMSQSLKNRNVRQFRYVSLYQDGPLKEDEQNWEYYRLSLARMKYISSRSTHWRITCNFPQDGLKYVDYVRGRISDVDFLTFNGTSACKKVEQINVISHNCTDCTVGFWQSGEMFHHDLGTNICEFGNTPGNDKSEDAFGFYSTINSKFRCCSSLNSTTNHWLGSQV